MGGLIGSRIDMYKKEKFVKWIEFFRTEYGYTESMFWVSYYI